MFFYDFISLSNRLLCAGRKQLYGISEWNFSCYPIIHLPILPDFLIT